jgi:hypothetical protein
METDVKKPSLFSTKLDLGELANRLVELTKSQRKGLQKSREGYPEASQEVQDNQQEFGTQAGVTDADIAALVLYDFVVSRIDYYLPTVATLFDRLVDTRYYFDDKRQRLLFTIAQTVERRGRDNPVLLARYEKVIKYRSAIGLKAAFTRRKNAKEQQENDTGGASQGTQDSKPKPKAAPRKSRSRAAAALGHVLKVNGATEATTSPTPDAK